MPPVPTYYWTARPNFGDLLTPFLLIRFTGLQAVWAAPKDARLVVAGSVLDSLPLSWTGVVAGAGMLHEHTRVDLATAMVLGVRGELSRKAIGLHGSKQHGEIVLGDPALLVDELVEPVKEHALGIVPHWTDHELADRFAHLGGHVISPAQDPLTVVTEIASCERIVASSLHGVIVADAFRIPRRAEPFAPQQYEGGTWKFEDYASGLGVPMKFGEMQEVKSEKIEARQAELFDMLRSVPGVLADLT